MALELEWLYRSVASNDAFYDADAHAYSQASSRLLKRVVELCRGRFVNRPTLTSTSSACTQIALGQPQQFGSSALDAAGPLQGLGNGLLFQFLHLRGQGVCNWRGRCFCTSTGKSARVTTGPRAMTTARSTMFCNSRTLPG